MTEQKNEKEVKEKSIKMIPPTGKFFADGFNIIADKITKDLNEFSERQNDPEVKQLYITYRTMIVNWQDMARGFLNECLNIPELVENDFYEGLTHLAEYCERHANKETAEKENLDGKPMAIKHKLIVSIMFSCIAGAAIIGWEWSTFRNNIVTNVSTQAEMIAENCKAALAFQDVEDTKETLSALHVEPSIVFGSVYTKDNKLFAAYYRDYVEMKVHPKEFQSNGFSFDDGFLNVFRPIVLDGEIIGTVCLRSDMSPMHAMLKRNTSVIIAVLFLSSFAAFLVLSGLQAVGNFWVSRKMKIRGNLIIILMVFFAGFVAARLIHTSSLSSVKSFDEIQPTYKEVDLGPAPTTTEDNWKPKSAVEVFPIRAEDTATKTVYITRTGSKYHQGSCRYLSKSKIPISLKEAKTRYSPCSACNPPQ